MSASTLLNLITTNKHSKNLHQLVYWCFHLRSNSTIWKYRQLRN